ncbi:MAG: hypothetical protein ACTS3F_02430 [Phycisphaerales bacterium]
MPGLTNSKDKPWMLAAVFGVDKADRVQCQCKGCGHAVYRRVHMIVWSDGRIECWGGICYQRELGVAARELGIKPMFTGTGGHRLTAEERAMLDENRERLIERFKERWERELAASGVAATARQATREPAISQAASTVIDADAVQEEINQVAIKLAKQKRARSWQYRR